MLRYIIPLLYIHSFHLFSSINGTSVHTTTSHQHQQVRKIFLQFPPNFFLLIIFTKPTDSSYINILVHFSSCFPCGCGDKSGSMDYQIFAFLQNFPDFSWQIYHFWLRLLAKMKFSSLRICRKNCISFPYDDDTIFSAVNFFTFSPTPPFP